MHSLQVVLTWTSAHFMRDWNPLLRAWAQAASWPLGGPLGSSVLRQAPVTAIPGVASRRGQATTTTTSRSGPSNSYVGPAPITRPELVSRSSRTPFVFRRSQGTFVPKGGSPICPKNFGSHRSGAPRGQLIRGLTTPNAGLLEGRAGANESQFWLTPRAT